MNDLSPDQKQIVDALIQEPERKGSIGTVIAILLIVVLLVLGAFYVWGQRLAEKQQAQQATTTQQ